MCAVSSTHQLSHLLLDYNSASLYCTIPDFSFTRSTKPQSFLFLCRCFTLKMLTVRTPESFQSVATEHLCGGSCFVLVHAGALTPFHFISSWVFFAWL